MYTKYNRYSYFRHRASLPHRVIRFGSNLTYLYLSPMSHYRGRLPHLTMRNVISDVMPDSLDGDMLLEFAMTVQRRLNLRVPKLLTWFSDAIPEAPANNILNRSPSTSCWTCWLLRWYYNFWCETLTVNTNAGISWYPLWQHPKPRRWPSTHFWEWSLLRSRRLYEEGYSTIYSAKLCKLTCPIYLVLEAPIMTASPCSLKQ